MFIARMIQGYLEGMTPQEQEEKLREILHELSDDQLMASGRVLRARLIERGLIRVDASRRHDNRIRRSQPVID